MDSNQVPWQLGERQADLPRDMPQVQSQHGTSAQTARWVPYGAFSNVRYAPMPNPTRKVPRPPTMTIQQYCDHASIVFPAREGPASPELTHQPYSIVACLLQAGNVVSSLSPTSARPLCVSGPYGLHVRTCHEALR